MEIRELEIRKVSPNLRTICTEECILEIAGSIKLLGQLEPILVYFQTDSFRILDGEKRYRACRRLGMKRIKAIISSAA